MGDVFADATFTGPGGRQEKLRLLVDTGSTYTWIPARIARELGIEPSEVGTFYTADRRRIRRRVGQAEIKILGRHGTRFVVFARESDESLIGVDTLQGLLLYVDPVDHRLRKRKSALALSPRAVGVVRMRRRRTKAATVRSRPPMPS